MAVEQLLIVVEELILPNFVRKFHGGITIVTGAAELSLQKSLKLLRSGMVIVFNMKEIPVN
jgi:hypothetical protein